MANAKRKWDKKEMAADIGISIPTLNKRLKKLKLFDTKINKSTYKNIYERVTKNEFKDPNLKTLATPITNFEDKYALPLFTASSEELNKIVENLIDKYNFYEHTMRRIEKEIKKIESNANSLLESKILRDEHLKLQSSQNKVIKSITDICGDLLPQQTQDVNIMSNDLEDMV